MTNLTLKQIKDKLVMDRNWNNILHPTVVESAGGFIFEYHNMEGYSNMMLHVEYKGKVVARVTINTKGIKNDTLEFKNKMLVDVIQKIEAKQKEVKQPKMNYYTVYYREKGNTKGEIFETSLMAENINEAREETRLYLEKEYTIVKIKRDYLQK